MLSARREQARALADAIDRALLRSAAADLQRVLELSQREDAARAADRVQLRAKRLAKTHAAQRIHVLAAAGTLILRLYGAAVPADWLYGWCDASVDRSASPRCAGAGGVILDGRGREFARVCEPIAEAEPFVAEIAALEAVLRAAAGRREHARRIRIYTDCDALVSLWLQRRRDPRLSAVRALARRLLRFELRRVPRRHNQIAHRLAREAVVES